MHNPKSGINPVLDAQKYRVFHVPGSDHKQKLRLFYKTRNVSACFDGIFGRIRLPAGDSREANQGPVSYKNIRELEKGFPSA